MRKNIMIILLILAGFLLNAQDSAVYQDLRQPEIGVVEKLDTFIAEDIMGTSIN